MTTATISKTTETAGALDDAGRRLVAASQAVRDTERATNRARGHARRKGASLTTIKKFEQAQADEHAAKVEFRAASAAHRIALVDFHAAVKIERPDQFAEWAADCTPSLLADVEARAAEMSGEPEPMPAEEAQTVTDIIEQVEQAAAVAVPMTLCDLCGRAIPFQARRGGQFCNDWSHCATKIGGLGGPFQVKPVADFTLGTGMTYGLNGDDSPYTVIAINEARSIVVVQSDKAHRSPDGVTFERDYHGAVRILELVKTGKHAGRFKSAPGEPIGFWYFFGRASHRTRER